MSNLVAEYKPVRGAHKVVDIGGHRYGALVALRATGESHPYRGRLWEFRCDCGNLFVGAASRVRQGHNKSCGCHASGVSKAIASSTHGMSKTPTYTTWYGMLARCRNPNVTHFAEYGGRGISVCERWVKFENFLADMGERPKNSTLDRVDVNGDYEPSNCRWASKAQQSRNKRTNRFYTYAGKTMCLRDWIKEITGE